MSEDENQMPIEEVFDVVVGVLDRIVMRLHRLRRLQAVGAPHAVVMKEWELIDRALEEAHMLGIPRPETPEESNRSYEETARRMGHDPNDPNDVSDPNMPFLEVYKQIRDAVDKRLRDEPLD